MIFRKKLQVVNFWDGADRHVVIAMERIESTTNGYRLRYLV